LVLTKSLIYITGLLLGAHDSSSAFPPYVIVIIVVGLMILLAVAMTFVTVMAFRRHAAGELPFTNTIILLNLVL